MAEQPRPQWIYQFLPGTRPELGRDPDAWTEEDNRVAADHFAYLSRAADDGRVILAGRAQDWEGPAIVIIEAATRDEAATFMSEDPFILFTARVHPFRAAIARRPASRPGEGPGHVHLR